MPTAHAIIVAGGVSSRFLSPMPKQFQSLRGRPLLAHTVERFRLSGVIEKLILVLPREGFENAKRIMGPHLGDPGWIEVVPGGNSRQDSMKEGFATIPHGFEGLVAVHDGARPLVPPSLITRVVEAAEAGGAAIAALPVSDTLKEASGDLWIERTISRERLYRAQTPQCFRYRILDEALERAAREDFRGTDEASLVERLPAPVRIVLGSEQNLKVTTLEDLKLVEYYLRNEGE